MTLATRIRNEDLAAAVCALIAAGEVESSQRFAEELRVRLAPPGFAADVAGGELVEELRARVAELEAELALANDAARQRKKRRQKDRSEPLLERIVPDVSLDVSDVSSSDLSKKIDPREPEKTPAKRPPDVPVHHEPTAPEWAVEQWTDVRPDLAECFFRRCWERFARTNPSHPSLSAAKRHFRAWLKREDARPLERTEDAPPPESGFRPLAPARPRAPSAVEARRLAIGQSLALLELDEARATGPPGTAPGCA